MKYLLFSILLLTILSCTQKSEKISHIKGKVVDRDSKALILQKAHDDTQSTDFIRIPITNQSFSFDIEYIDVVAYRLIFEDELNDGAWRPIKFIPFDGEIEMTLYSMDRFEENEITGGTMTNDIIELENNLYSEYRNKADPLYDRIDMLKENDLYFSDSMRIFMAQYHIEDEYSDNGDRELYNQLTRLRDSGIAYSDTVNSIKKQIQNEYKDNRMDLYDQINQRKDIVSYFVLIDRLMHFNPKFDDLDRLTSLQKDLSQKFEGHPYNQLSEDLLWSRKNIRVGGDYYDFSLPDLDQTHHTLSKEIKDQYALLLVWAPWCAPCIKLNREMVPVYEKYKDKGLTALEVVGRYKSPEEAEEIIKKENYPWLHLIDSTWNSEVWINYGLAQAGGSVFLIDNTGKILAVKPGAVEVDRILSAALLE